MDTLDAWPIGEDPRVTAHSSFSAKRSSHHVSCRPGCSLNFLRLERHSKQNRVFHLDVRCARRYIICRQIVWRLFDCRAINPVTTARLVVRGFTIHHHGAPLPPAPQLANSHSPSLQPASIHPLKDDRQLQLAKRTQEQGRFPPPETPPHDHR